MLTRGQGPAAIEHPDVVEAQESSAEDVVAVRILAVHPPREVHEQLVEHALEERVIARAARPRELVHAPGSPRVRRRVDVVERELVRRDLTVRMHVPFAQQQDELLFRELWVEPRERHHLKGDVPRRIPRILPLIRHRDHVAVVQMLPFAIACLPPNGRRRGKGRITLEPLADRIVIRLLRPQQPGVCLPRDAVFFRRRLPRNQGVVEFVGFSLAPLERRIEITAEEFVHLAPAA